MQLSNIQLVNKQLVYYKKLSPANNTANLPHIIWGHGWAQDHQSLLPIATSLQHVANHWLIDFPGFGSSSKPTDTWGSKEYANLTTEWIKMNIATDATKIWVGHSFGCRIGIAIASLNPHLLHGLFLIAAAGVPRPISLTKKIIRLIKINCFKLLKNLIILFNNINHKQHLNWIRTKFGSHDYKNADPEMRDILVKTINENLSCHAQKINCPTELLYGNNDNDTPLIMGNTLNKLIKNSILHVIPNKDHHSVLQEDIHQVAYLLNKFINKIQDGKLANINDC